MTTDIKKARKILSIVPIGIIEPGILNALAAHLDKTFPVDPSIRASLHIPDTAYDPGRRQYRSGDILALLRKFESAKVLGISDKDLYSGKLNFIFGEAECPGTYALISMARLRQEFYGLPADKELLLKRTIKEAVHELGHTYGLTHCAKRDCVMHFSGSLHDTDRKQSAFCPKCFKSLDI